MNHSDHVNLLRGGIPGQGGRWADLGSGAGAFTLALRELVGADAEIFSVDKDARALNEQRRAMETRFPNSRVEYIYADFTRALTVPPLDGVVMANALHFVRDKENLLRRVREYLKNDGRLILVEYNTDAGNMWVPHPLSFETFRALASRVGFGMPRLMASVPSRFLREIYSALALK
jgi:ubiquinone/menaquinone biosynthesis C-methylase UbiE